MSPKETSPIVDQMGVGATVLPPVGTRPSTPKVSTRTKPKPKADSIGKLTQVMVTSLDSVDKTITKLDASIESMVGKFTDAIGKLGEEVKEVNKDIADTVKHSAEGVEKTSEDIDKGTKKTGMQLVTSVQRWSKLIIGGIGFIIGAITSGITKVVKIIQQATEFNLFGWLADRAKAIFSLLKDNIMGMGEALATLRKGEEMVVQWQQEYGLSAQYGRMQHEHSRAMANTIINSQQYMDAFGALQKAGLRGFNDEVQEVADQLAVVNQATGASLDTLSKTYMRFTEDLNMSSEEAFNHFDTINRLNQGISDLNIRSSLTTEQYVQAIDSRHEDILAIANGDLDAQQNLIEASIYTDALSSASGLDQNFLWDLLREGTEANAKIASLLHYSPEQLETMMEEGNTTEAIEMIIKDLDNLYDGNSVMVATELGKVLDVTSAQAQKLVDGMATYGNDIQVTLNQATNDLVGSTVEETAEKALTPLQRMNNELQMFAQGLEFNGVSLLDIVQNLELFMPYIEGLQGGIDMLHGSMDMAFGPLSPFIKGPATFLTMIAGVGLATTEFSEEQQNQLGIFNDYANLATNVIDQIKDKFGDVIPQIMEGITNIFDKVGDEKSIFEVMFENGVTWLGSRGVNYTDVLMDALNGMLEKLGDALNGTTLSQNTGIGKFLGNLMEKMAEGIKNLVNIVLPVMREFLGALKSVLDDPSLVASMTETITILGQTMADTAGTLWEDIFKPIVMPIVKSLIGTVFFSLGKALQDTRFAPGLDGMMNSLGGGLMQMSAQALNGDASELTSQDDFTISETILDLYKDESRSIEELDALVAGYKAQRAITHSGTSLDVINDLADQGQALGHAHRWGFDISTLRSGTDDFIEAVNLAIDNQTLTSSADLIRLLATRGSMPGNTYQDMQTMTEWRAHWEPEINRLNPATLEPTYDTATADTSYLREWDRGTGTGDTSAGGGGGSTTPALTDNSVAPPLDPSWVNYIDVDNPDTASTYLEVAMGEGLIAPLSGGLELTSGFHRAESGNYHGAADFVSDDMSSGVRAMTDGIVVATGRFTFGKFAQVYHPSLDSLATYGHLNSTVPVGTSLKQGDIIAYLQPKGRGDNGKEYPQHLHLSLQHAPPGMHAQATSAMANGVVDDNFDWGSARGTTSSGGIDIQGERANRINTEAVAGTMSDWGTRTQSSVANENYTAGYEMNALLSETSTKGVRGYNTLEKYKGGFTIDINPDQMTHIEQKMMSLQESLDSIQGTNQEIADATVETRYEFAGLCG